MNAVYSILFLQALMGAFDNLWHHELGARLPQRASARHELALHAAREAIYGLLFIGLAWFEWHGLWALVPAALLLSELIITCADFLEEDRSRNLPPLERVLHTLLAVSFGLLLGFLAPVLLHWLQLPSAVVVTPRGAVSWIFTAGGLAVMLWSARNALASWQQRREPAEATNPLPGTTRHVVARPGAPAVLVTGGTGFIGATLVRQLIAQGLRIIVLTRDVRQTRLMFNNRVWAVERLNDIPAEARIGSIVHLAGAPVLGMPWTRRRRALLVQSRTRVMESLMQLMRRLHEPPSVLVAASAVGYYGQPGFDVSTTEASPPDPGRFQSDLCLAAEHEALRAEALGVRVVRMRFGIVLGREGGAFPGLSLSARLGLGARIGCGTQPVPWVHIDDAVAAVQFAMGQAGLHGPVNAVAPQVVSQSRFSQAMAAAHGRRAWLRIPAWLLRGGLGEMSQLLTHGQHVVPVVALKAGFRFAYPSLAGALNDLVKKTR